MNIFYNFMELLACGCMFWVPFFFSRIFLKRRSKLPLYHLLLLMIVYTAASYLPSGYLANTIVSVICTLLQFLLIALCYEGHMLSKVLSIIGSTALDIMISIIFVSFFSFTLHVSNDQLMTSGTPVRFLFLMSSILFEYLLLFLLNRTGEKGKYIGSKEISILLLFVLNDAFSLFLTYLVLMSTESNWVKIICCIIACAFLLATAGVLALLYIINKQAGQLYENQFLACQVREQEKQILQYHENDKHLKEIRHDMKRYLLNYRTLMEAGNYAAVQTDIDEMINHRLSANTVTYTTNLLLNSILCHAADICKDNGISISTHISVPDTFQDIEVMVLISNLLDNAIEAVQNNPMDCREIAISIGTMNNQLSIVVKNRIPASVLAHNPDLNSQKSDSTSHGYGLKSVKRLVTAREGLMSFSEEDGLFIAHVLLPFF